MKSFNYFNVSFDVDGADELLEQIEKAESLIRELKDVLYRISGARGEITVKGIPPTFDDGTEINQDN